MEPKQANDVWLWNKVTEKLESLGVKIVHEKVYFVNDDTQKVTGVTTHQITYTSDMVILSTPPVHTREIMMSSSDFVKNAFMPKELLDSYVSSSSYFPYISFTIHLEKNTVLPKVWGGKKTNDWNIAWIVMSDYIRDEKTDFITATIMDLNSKSSHTGLTANETSNEKEMLQEATRQVMTSLQSQSIPRTVVLNKGVFFEETWNTTDLPFMLTPKTEKVEAFGSIPNFFWVGPHNLNNKYAFTSMENVCQNVILFCNKLDKDINVNIKYGWELNTAIFYILILCIAFLILKSNKKK